LFGARALPNDPQTNSVECIITENDIPRAWSLSRGQTVKLKGEVVGAIKVPGQSSVILSNCQIVSVGDDPSIAVTAAALLEEFKTNPAQADKKYKGKEITIREATVERRDGLTLILMDAAKKDVTVKIQAAMLQGTQQQIESLAPGARVKLKGECVGLSNQMIQIERCWLVP
jgi:hypothetical protein